MQFNFQKHRSRQKSFCTLAGVLVAALLLCGCAENKTYVAEVTEDLVQEKAELRKEVVKSREDVTGQKLNKNPGGNMEVFNVNGIASDAASHRTDLPFGETADSFEGITASSDEDFLDKADVFWKLNWMKQQLEKKNVPTDLPEAVKKTRQILKKTHRDSDYMLAEEALNAVEEGLVHHAAEKTLQKANIVSALIPWYMGSAPIEQYIAEGKLGFGGKSTTMKTTGFRDDEDEQPLYKRMGKAANLHLTTTQREAVVVVQKYAETYKDAPEVLAEKSWKIAIQKTEALLENLREHPAFKRHPGLENANTKAEKLLPNYPGSKLAERSSIPTNHLDKAIPVPEISNPSRQTETGVKDR